MKVWLNQGLVLCLLVTACFAHQKHFSQFPDLTTETECYPFCSDANPTVSEMETARYRDRLGTLAWVDPRIGTNGADPSEYGGMVPSVALPFAGVRTVPMTRENKISGCAYHDNDTINIGFLASRQPAIWMGDYGFATLFTGMGEVKLGTNERGLQFSREDEFVSPYKYAVRMGNSSESQVFAQMAGKSRSAMFEFHYDSTYRPFIGVQASRDGWRGAVNIDVDKGEISGYNPERMDYRLGPHPAPGFRGYFVYRLEYQKRGSESWLTALATENVGTAHSNSTGITLHPRERSRWNELGVYAYARFPQDTKKVRIRLGTSLISEAQARHNLQTEMPDGTELANVVDELIESWQSKTDRIKVEGGSDSQKRILYTGIFHASQYPAEHAEPMPSTKTHFHYYSAYTDTVHKVEQGQQRYQSWSIWDIYRAQWNYLILFEPDRVTDMVRSLLEIYDQSGFLPMWANLAETNIMISTHADSLIAEAVVKGVDGFDLHKAWEAVLKDGTVPPERESELRYEDREEFTPLEVRAGLSFYNKSGFVPLDGWSESSSRTLDYAYDDYAIHVLAKHLGHQQEAEFFYNRSKNYRNVFDPSQGVMAARFKNGSFLVQPLLNPLGRQEGFTEGNMFDYSFDVVQDIPGLADLIGGREALIKLLDQHFGEGHNDQSNEPSHHIPYLYAQLGQAYRTQEWVRKISHSAYSDQPDGYAGNEDCGQQSAWYIFSSMGIYPVSPISGEYVVSSPFFERMDIQIPARHRDNGKTLTIIAPSANDSCIYVKSLLVNGRQIDEPKLSWSDLISGGLWQFELSNSPQAWGTSSTMHCDTLPGLRS